MDSEEKIPSAITEKGIGFTFTRTWTDDLASRTLPDVLESVYIPGGVYLLSTWYSRYELHKRYSLFYCIGLIAQAIANVLAFGLGKMEGCRIFEGGDGFHHRGVAQITGVVGLLTYFLVVEFPDKCHKSWRFLSEDEAAFIIRRLNIDRDDAVPGDSL
ncbi:predicted protein [Aspergillus terreus NIH2624]|uniref:Uncharacterized protein n=1 Tax=Aspergillus terreus (strain NIH 2624 / FGSC A1156) TaxID=341663 RepID=Q0CB62_ASPTN|nr:uncharacterized protein ATEG_09072 [Aspergillus terreus NIH2624]EAU30209.1 predicted protein [Aspergillus terreus NIH2624]